MDEFIDKFADLMNTYPPLWMVYGFVLVLPFVLMACCFIKPKSKDDAARRKKTDEPSPDVKPSGKKEPQKADGATLVGSQAPKESTTPTSSASRPEIPAQQETSDIRQRSGGKSSAQSGKEKAQAKHTVLVTEVPSAPPPASEEQTEEGGEEGGEYTLKEEDVGSVVVVSKTKHDQTSVRDVEENAEEKQRGQTGTEQTESKVEEEGKPVVAVKTASVSSKKETSESMELGEMEGEMSFFLHRFPPVLEDFDLMECEADPSVVEEYLADPRLKEIFLTLSGEEQLGLIIVGGADSPNGSLPIYIKKVVPGGVASKDDRISEGDQLLAVNDKILLECSNSYAVDVMRKAKGKTRLLVLQDY